MLLPALTRARSQAESAVCRSNLRQISLVGLGLDVQQGGRYPDMNTVFDHLEPFVSGALARG